MPSIRHVAIKCENPAIVADFYKNVFELKEVWRRNSNVYMSDGLFSLVLLKTQEGEKPGYQPLRLPGRRHGGDAAPPRTRGG